MSRFADINGMIVNIDTISKAYVQNGKARIVYKDGTAEESQYISDIYQIAGKNYIRQIVPVKAPTVAIYKDDYGKLYETEILYLGLTELGELRPLELSGGCYDFADSAANFVGIEEKGVIKWAEHQEKPD